MSWRGRLIAEDYSNSTQQKRSQSNYWQQLYWGRLRLDSIVARTLVIPDTYLIDGRFFLSTGPLEMAAQLACDESSTTPFLEVRSRHSDLQTTLRDVLIRPGEDYLNRFRIHSITSDEDRETLAQRLSLIRADDLQSRMYDNTPDRAIGGLLVELTRDLSVETQETVEMLERGWNR